MIALKRLATSAPDFAARLAALLSFESAQDPAVDAAVAAILTDVNTEVTGLRQWDHAVAEPELGLDGFTCRVVLTVEQVTELKGRRRYQCVVVTEKVVDSS